MRRQVLVGAVLLIMVGAILTLGALSSTAHVDGWYADAAKVPWTPPNPTFGIVWTLLYLAIAIAGWLIWRRGYTRGAANAQRPILWLFGVQLALNACWTPVFFAGYPVIGPTAWWIALAIIAALLAVVVVLAARTWRRVRAAGIVMGVYGLWLAYAASLNAGIIALN